MLLPGEHRSNRVCHHGAARSDTEKPSTALSDAAGGFVLKPLRAYCSALTGGMIRRDPPVSGALGSHPLRFCAKRIDRFMLNYETLDAIADAYIPLLLMVAGAIVAAPLLKAQWSLLRSRALMLLAMLAVAYGGMFLDNALQIWPLLGLDYSTHTAVALVLVWFIGCIYRKGAGVLAVSLLLYCLLMTYQRYHTWADIAVTAVAVALPAGLLLAGLFRPRPIDCKRSK